MESDQIDHARRNGSSNWAKWEQQHQPNLTFRSNTSLYNRDSSRRETYILVELITLHGLIILCFLHRALLTYNQPIQFDGWGHLYYSVLVKEQKSGPFGPIEPNVVAKGKFHYPLLFHWIISRLPRRVLLKFNKLVCPTLDASILAISIFYFSKQEIDIKIIFVASLLYIFGPSYFSKISIGPRSTLFSTRIFSELFFTIAIMNLIFMDRLFYNCPKLVLVYCEKHDFRHKKDKKVF